MSDAPGSDQVVVPSTETQAKDASTPEQASASETPQVPAAAETASADAAAPATAPGSASQGGPISLDKIRQLRQSQQKHRPPAVRLAAIPGQANSGQAGAGQASSAGGAAKSPKTTFTALTDSQPAKPIKPAPAGPAPKVAVPSRRHALSKDLQDELEAAIAGSDLDKILVGDSMSQVGRILEEGQRVQAKVMKVQEEFVFVSLGGPDEGIVPTLHFETLPEIGSQIEVIVRGYLESEGMFEVTVPGNAVSVSDWSDLNEGEVVEAVVTGTNTGGLECKVGAIEGFIPISQVAEYRVEDLSEFADQKFLCVVTEANPRRGNLVLSRRAVLEREKSEKRAERLANLEIGAAVDGTVRKIMDFGAFVDIGGLDGLLHISQLSWDRVKHPSEVLEEGQQIKVRVDKIDETSGKIALSYRSLQDDPWEGIDANFPIGAIVKGTVTRIAEFGAFVKISTGVEGLVHVSELAHHRVSSVGNVVSEGEEITVKVLSVDGEQQRIGLSIKAALAAPEPEKSDDESVEEEPAKPILPKHQGPLKGGIARDGGGEQFGLKW